MAINKINITDNFFSMIKNLSTEVKLELIKRIQESLKSSKPNDLDYDSWKNLYGAFKSEKTAEEIIDDIRASRYTDRQIEDI